MSKLSRLRAQLSARLSRIYGTDEPLQPILQAIEAHQQRYNPPRRGALGADDIVLITYGDSILPEQGAPLEALLRFLQPLQSVFRGVHVLPFFPYSSDDGFSVIDYLMVDYKLGQQQQIEQLAQQFDLMADLVLNHVSRQSLWFIDFINGEGEGAEYFIEADPHGDYSKVVRPRTHPVVVDVYTRQGIKHVWATFSEDQIDLNFANPAVLVAMIQVILRYLEMGSRYVRLDAVAFLWKEQGTSCIHLPQTHEVVKLLRDIFDYLDPELVLITETNVPHQENISYFGNADEAHMVYNFALPPLVLHGLNRGNASYITRWASKLPQLPAKCSFFNFTASHDGIGVRAVEGIIPKHELEDLINSVHAYGGFVSMKANGDGTRSPYELNISLFDALQGTRSGPDLYHVPRFLCSQIIMLALKGVPAMYIHSLTATPNDIQKVELTGRTRSINRHRWKEAELNQLLADPLSHQHKVYQALTRIMQVRAQQSAMAPDAPQQVLALSDSLFTLIRGDSLCSQQLLCIHNMSAYQQPIHALDKIPGCFLGPCINVLDQQTIDLTELTLEPYQCVWLQPLSGAEPS